MQFEGVSSNLALIAPVNYQMHSTKLDNQRAVCKINHCEHAKERCKEIPLNAVSIVPGGRTKFSNERQQTWTAAAPLNGNKVRWQDSIGLRLSLYDEDDVGGEVALSIGGGGRTRRDSRLKKRKHGWTC
jgi:hypothetical protein